MYTEDLQELANDKDTTKSCIFDFPDRPIDSFPPDYPPIDPPECFPWCPGDDWPPLPPVPPIIIPPGLNPLPAGYDLLSISSLMSYARTTGYQSNDLFWYKTTVTIQMEPDFQLILPIHLNGHTTPTNVGGAGTDLDHAYSYVSNLDGDAFDLQIGNLVTYLISQGGATGGKIKFIFDSRIYASPLYSGGTLNETLLYLINLPHSLQSFFGGFLDSQEILPSVDVASPLGFNNMLSPNHYGSINTWVVYYNSASGRFYAEPLVYSEGIYIP